MLDFSNYPSRILLKVILEPLGGKDIPIQPVGFKDLGSVMYDVPNESGQRLIVDTQASLANHLESLMLQPDKINLVKCLNGLPHVRVIKKETKEILTTSLLEPHRLASPYIFGTKNDKTLFGKDLQEKLVKSNKSPGYFQELARLLFDYDPNSLLHGIFFAFLEGSRNRISRAISAEIIGIDARDIPLGGVKLDPVQAKKSEGKSSDEGYGNVPYYRRKYIADKYLLIYKIDIEQIRNYALDTNLSETDSKNSLDRASSKPRENLLIALSLWKILKFLDQPRRMRTECDFESTKIDSNIELPNLQDLERDIVDLITNAYQNTNNSIYSDKQLRIVEVIHEEKKARSKKSNSPNKNQIESEEEE